MLLLITPTGQTRCLYTELIDLARLGELSITRASHLEPDQHGRWWADLGPVNGPRLGPFGQRSQGLAMEQKWLEIHRLLMEEHPHTQEKQVGLTIHYKLSTHLERVQDVRFAIEAMRQAASKLPFKEVGDVIEFKGKELAAGAAKDRDDPHRWLKIQAGHYFEHGGDHFRAQPTHIIGFETWPGEGCEPANFGLCRYPATVELELQPGRRRNVPTGLLGWRWKSFCKTQYASDPACGGVENFVRCHLLVTAMLDHMAKSGWFTAQVSDESGYWEDRDAPKLAQCVGQWNEMIAAVVGQIKDGAGSMGQGIDAPITQYPNFELLEARGQERLRKS